MRAPPHLRCPIGSNFWGLEKRPLRAFTQGWRNNRPTRASPVCLQRRCMPPMAPAHVVSARAPRAAALRARNGATSSSRCFLPAPSPPTQRSRKRPCFQSLLGTFRARPRSSICTSFRWTPKILPFAATLTTRRAPSWRRLQAPWAATARLLQRLRRAPSSLLLGLLRTLLPWPGALPCRSTWRLPRSARRRHQVATSIPRMLKRCGASLSRVRKRCGGALPRRCAAISTWRSWLTGARGGVCSTRRRSCATSC